MLASRVLNCFSPVHGLRNNAALMKLCSIDRHLANTSVVSNNHKCHPIASNLNTTTAGYFGVSQRRYFTEDTKTKSLTVWNNLRELRTSPLPALTLGLSGLIPFVSAPVYMLSAGAFMANLATAQIAYGATILSFLGGVRWGLTLPEESHIPPDWINLGYSVVPSLIAWGGLLLPHPWSLLTVMGGLTFVAYYDMAMYGYPAWFKGLRFLLSLVALLSLWSTFMIRFILKGNDNIDSVELNTGDSEMVKK